MSHDLCFASALICNSFFTFRLVTCKNQFIVFKIIQANGSGAYPAVLIKCPNRAAQLDPFSCACTPRVCATINKSSKHGAVVTQAGIYPENTLMFYEVHHIVFHCSRHQYSISKILFHNLINDNEII